MRFIDGLQLHGRPVHIPDSSRNDLPELFVELGYKVGAEIGVYKAAFTEKFVKAGLTMYAIDPWLGYKGAGRSQQDQARQDFLYGHSQRVLAPYPKATIIRTTSQEGVLQFQDSSLDFVYIDADHSFPHIAQDLFSWAKKVRSGGMVSGHDYFYTSPRSTNVIIHVGPVVDAYVKTFEIPNLYIFGAGKKPTDKDDRYPSWMFMKP